MDRAFLRRRFSGFLPVFVRPSKKSNIATIETHKPRQRIARERRVCMPNMRVIVYVIAVRCRDIVPGLACPSVPNVRMALWTVPFTGESVQNGMLTIKPQPFRLSEKRSHLFPYLKATIKFPTGSWRDVAVPLQELCGSRRARGNQQTFRKARPLRSSISGR